MTESEGLSDHRAAATMEPQLSGGCDFEFAFNSENFSDRVLRIEIAPDLPDGEPGAGRGRKRRREEVTIKRKGDEPLFCDFPLGSTDFSKAPRVKSMYISSAILAATSPYFLKLFSSGEQESDRRQTTLQINASEEAALMELLGFIYRGKLTTISPALLLDVLMAADKFEVSSCTRLCMQLLMSLPMTTEYALLYLELPSTVSMPSAVQQLTDAAKEFLTNKYRDTSKLQHEVMNLPLAGIEVIFCSNNLQVTSEDAIYDLLVKWARARYPQVEERREIMASHLAHLIRFPHMTCKKLGKLLTSNDLDKQLATKLVTEALFFKAEAPHQRWALASGLTACGQFAGRAYTCRPTKVVEFDRPHQQCIIYLDLKREECAKLFPSGRIYSQAFHLGSHGFFLSGRCNVEQLSSKHCFGVFLYMLEKPAVTFMVNYEFAARVKPSGEFVGRHKGCYNFTRGKAVGYRNLFGMLWSSFLADDSPYFINDILHLRAQLNIK